YFFNNAAPITPEDGGDPTAVTQPVVDVWYGDTQDFGQLGIPQHWANILGRVWDTDAIETLYYSLNGGPTSPLTIGTDSPRLVDDGDYNIEIDYGDLNPGANQVVITAIDTLGERRDKTVTVNYTDGVTWALPYTAEFETSGSIMDEAHVVDGRWYVADGEGVRVDSSGTGYDRLIVLGDTTWVTDYEVLVPMTIHQSSLSTTAFTSGVGIGLGWKGNEGSDQPRLDAPYEAISWVKGFPDSTTLFLQGSGLKVSMTPNMEADVRYMMRTRSQSLGNGLSRVSTKLWEDGTPEPTDWTLTNDVPTMDGSVILIAHRSIATFGNVTVTPISSLNHELTLNVVGAGSVAKSPDQATYADGDTVLVSAFPDSGWVFAGWSGGLTGAENPDTIIMTSDTTVTANFSQIFNLAINVNGEGSVVASPDTTRFVDGDTVIVEAVPDPGWVFDSWADGLSGSANPETLLMVSDTTVTANFAAEAYTVTLNTVGAGSVTKLPDQASYLYGDTVIVEAVPDSGWVFDSWSDGLVGSENPDTIIVTQNLNVTANFVQTLMLTYRLCDRRSRSGMVFRSVVRRSERIGKPGHYRDGE
ncbi:MAG: InlB B-repeat-containing protein, partial [bacterium]